MTRSERRLVMIAAVVGLTLAVMLVFDLWPGLRGGDGWVWPYLPVQALGWLLLLVSGAAYTLVGVHFVRTQARPRRVLAWVMLGTIALSVLLSVLQNGGDGFYGLLARVLSATDAGEHWMALQIDWASGAWRDWVSQMIAFGTTPATAQPGTLPPGLPALFALTASGLEAVPPLVRVLAAPILEAQCHNFPLLIESPAWVASAWLGMLMPVWSALGVFPLYHAALRIAPNSDARWAALWWPLVPGIIAFYGSSSTVFPVMAAAALWALVRGLDDHAPRFWLLSGLLFGLATFTNFVFVAAAGVYGLYSLLHYVGIGRAAGRPAWTPLAVGVLFGLGSIVPWAAFYAVSGQTPMMMLSEAFGVHFGLVRSYGYWVVMSVWDWALWSGVAFALGALFALGQWRSDNRRAAYLSAALLASLVALTLSGVTRGEAGRVWLIFAPFALLACVGLAQNISSGARLSLAHLALMLAIAGGLRGFATPDISPVPVPPSVEISARLDAVYSDSQGALFRLTGWAGESDGRRIRLALAVEPLRRTDQILYFGAVPVAPDGTSVRLDPFLPRLPDDRGTVYPTTCWRPGQSFSFVTPLLIGTDAARGDWFISVAAFGDAALPNGQLNVSVSGTDELQVGVGPVTVPEFVPRRER